MILDFLAVTSLRFSQETQDDFTIEKDTVCMCACALCFCVSPVHMSMYVTERQHLLTLQLQPIYCDHSDKCLHMDTS